MIVTPITRYVSLAVALLGIAEANAEMREWKDHTGKHGIKASLESSDDGIVTLRTSTGKLVTLPEAKLSAADRAYVKNLGASAEKVAQKLREGEVDRPISDFHALQGAISSQRYARRVVAMHEEFLKNPSVSQLDRSFAKDSLPKWKKLADEGCEKYNGKWLSSVQIAKLRSESRSLVELATKLVARGENEEAKNNLLKASKVDPEGIEANFTLGLLYALVAGQPSDARKHFEVCIRRLKSLGSHRNALQTWNLGSALNNSAIAQVRERDFGSAVTRWKEVSELGVDFPELAQNVGRLDSLAARGDLAMPLGRARSIRQLAMAKNVEEDRYDPGIGWLYLPFLTDAAGHSGDSASAEAASLGSRQLKPFAMATAFAVSPQVLVASSDCVLGAEVIHVVDKNVDSKPLVGEVLSINDEGIALIRVPALSAQALLLSATLPQESLPGRLVHYPATSNGSGKRQSVAALIKPAKLARKTSGVVSALVQLTLDKPESCDPRGGPFIDSEGAVLAMSIGEFNASNRTAHAAPSPALLGFLEDQGLSLQSVKSPKFSDDPAVCAAGEKHALESTYAIRSLSRTARPAWLGGRGESKDEGPLRQPSGWTGYEDRWCMHCNGVGHIECTNRACRQGVVIVRKVKIIEIPNAPTRSQSIKATETCGVCNGNGRLSCPHCDDGFDSSL